MFRRYLMKEIERETENHFIRRKKGTQTGTWIYWIEILLFIIARCIHTQTHRQRNYSLMIVRSEPIPKKRIAAELWITWKMAVEDIIICYSIGWRWNREKFREFGSDIRLKSDELYEEDYMLSVTTSAAERRQTIVVRSKTYCIMANAMFMVFSFINIDTSHCSSHACSKLSWICQSPINFHTSFNWSSSGCCNAPHRLSVWTFFGWNNLRWHCTGENTTGCT